MIKNLETDMYIKNVIGIIDRYVDTIVFRIFNDKLFIDTYMDDFATIDDLRDESTDIMFKLMEKYCPSQGGDVCNGFIDTVISFKHGNYMNSFCLKKTDDTVNCILMKSFILTEMLLSKKYFNSM